MSCGVTCSAGGSGGVSGWLSFGFVFFNSFGVYLLVLLFQEPLCLPFSSLHQKPSSLSPSRGSSGFELGGGFVGKGCAALVSGWPVVPFSEA